jgi:hypothetical protein
MGGLELATREELDEGWQRYLVSRQEADAATRRGRGRQSVRLMEILSNRAYRLAAAALFLAVVPLLEFSELLNVFAGLDYSEHEPPSRRVAGVFMRSTVKADGITSRRVEFGGGSVAVLGANTMLRFRPSYGGGAVVRLEGEVTLEVANGTGMVYLATPVGEGTLTPGRYVVRSASGGSPMEVLVEEGVAGLRSRGRRQLHYFGPGSVVILRPGGVPEQAARAAEK